jgi:hypothetical protein
MVVAYGVANLLQSIAAADTALHQAFSPRLLWRLGQHKAYLFGVGFQFAGFALAFVARRDLPLFLVQSAVAAGLGVTAVLGVVLLKWRLPRTEMLLLTLLCFGLGGLIVAAEPMPSRPMGTIGVALLGVALVAIGGMGFLAVRLHGAQGSVVLGSLAGLSFGAAAVASRPLASVHVLDGFFLAEPLVYLLVGHSVVGQLLLGMAMQRGSTTAAVAAMDAAAAVPAAAIGLLFLGDSILAGREWIAALGFVGTLIAVIGLSFYAEPQHHHEVAHPEPHPPLRDLGGSRPVSRL